ncbi:GNAT family N-acetyltransferase [Aestuariibius sp. HNIBRBA575]|uniref:GNAT family N-acetyltransferase n=1 Tax=Aestuariibius sp. HNIBRBA575 TaxID=3233343 RepID=UPI0034A13D8E
MLKDGLYDVPMGMLASVVTHLEMCDKPADHYVSGRTDLKLVRHTSPSLDWYRALFKEIGAHWLWSSRLEIDSVDLEQIITNPLVEIYTIQLNDVDLALLELDFRVDGECELGFFGLTGKLIGTGAGRWLMAKAIEIAFSKEINRFHLHTCTLDSPQALEFYRKAGFIATRREIEIGPDPRVSGHLPTDTAPHVPLIK